MAGSQETVLVASSFFIIFDNIREIFGSLHMNNERRFIGDLFQNQGNTHHCHITVIFSFQ